MTSASDEPEQGITDEQLPDDLRPGPDNPLAEGLPPGESADLEGGKLADEMEAEPDDAPDDAPGSEPGGDGEAGAD